MAYGASFLHEIADILPFDDSCAACGIQTQRGHRARDDGGFHRREPLGEADGIDGLQELDGGGLAKALAFRV